MNGGNGSNGRYATKLEFPRFGGEGVEDWIFKVEQFFALDRIPEASKINVISLHLDRCALHWHKNFIKNKDRRVEWREYKEAIKIRFSLLAYDDPIAEMKKLKQTGTLQEYLVAFDSLLDRAQLREEQALSCFLAGLKHDIEIMVRMFNLRTLQAAYSLAKLQDSLKNDPNTSTTVGGKEAMSKIKGGQYFGGASKAVVPINTSSGGMIQKGNLPNANFRRPLNLTPKQLEEKRLQNQCYWCEEKFVPGHRCKNRQLYMITVQDEEQDMILDDEKELDGGKDRGTEREEQVLSTGNPYLSLHALEGTFNYQTMRINGSVRKKMLSVLIDTDSIHNFISYGVAFRLGCILETVPVLKVLAANGEKLKCNEVCKKFTWCM